MIETSLKHVETSQDSLPNYEFLRDKTQQIEGDMDKVREKIFHFNITMDIIGREMAVKETDFDNIMKERNESTHYELEQIKEVLGNLDIAVDIIQTKFTNFKEDADNLRKTVNEYTTSGTIYIRWGKTTCPETGSEAIYSGYVAGATMGIDSGSSTLCMPKDPEWNKYNESVYGEHIFGAEYYTDELFSGKHKFHNVPCAVCNVKARSSTIMIPAKRNCYSGWTLEYAGYLMSSHESSDFLCIDEHPENIPDSDSIEHGLDLIYIETLCESLKCPPYVGGRQLTCVVCTK